MDVGEAQGKRSTVWKRAQHPLVGGVTTVMEKRGGIRLSAMEIALLVVLLGSLALGLLQAWQQEQMERMLEAEHEQ